MTASRCLFRGDVQEKIDSKLRREREAQELIEREKREADAILAEKARVKAEHEAKLALEARTRAEVEDQIGKMKQAKVDVMGPVSWPLRPKPIYLSYAKDSGWEERVFVARSFNAMEEAGLYHRVWIDKDEGVLGSPYAIIDRYDALAAAQVKSTHPPSPTPSHVPQSQRTQSSRDADALSVGL